MRLMIVLLSFVACVSGCAHFKDGRAPSSATPIIPGLTLLHLNDVYEILPSSGTNTGGLARVASLKKDLSKTRPTFAVLAGDFIEPSPFGFAKVDGERLSGRQMISTLNVAKLDLAMFGNHEFNYDDATLKKRIGERKFDWISGNVRDNQGASYAGLAEYFILNRGGIKVGFLGATVEKKSSYAKFVKPIDYLETACQSIRGSVDIVVAVTHLDIEDDLKLADQTACIDLILGGHDHTQMHYIRGSRKVVVAKADANAKTAYIHHLTKGEQKVAIESELISIDEKISEDPETKKISDEWRNKAFKFFEDNGFKPLEVLAQTKVPLDGLESAVRGPKCSLCQVIGQAYLHEAPDASIAFFTGGGIRIDDVIPPGPITEYDILRMLPFGDKVTTLKITGAEIKDLLKRNVVGSGQYFHLIPRNPEMKMEDETTYTIVSNDYFLKVYFAKREPLSIGRDNRLMLKSFLQKVGTIERTTY